MDLVNKGEIPNELLGVVSEFVDDPKKNPFVGEDNSFKTESFGRFAKLLHLIAEAVLVEPTYKEIEKEVGALPDNMLMDIWSYSMFGQRELQRFRKQQRSRATFRNGSQILGKSTE